MKRQLFTLALLLCAVMGNATAIFNGQGQGTQSSPYEIWNLDRLNEVRNFVGDESAGVYFRLEKDLDLTEYLEGLSWEAIGTSTEPFKGFFLGKGSDGKSHKITGMTINESSNYQGFFGFISDATIQDLTIEGTVGGGGYVGGIVGGSSGANIIKNCTFNGSVTGTDSYVGGIAGYFTGTLNNVNHTGITKGTGYVGGIVGQHASGSMTTATNTGNVTATTSSYAGGIAGLSQVAMSSANSKGTVSGKQYTGGLAGSATGSAVSNCSAEGNVTGTSYTGGLIGGKSGGTVSGCSSKGTVNGSSYTGGLIGQCSGTVSNSRHIEGKVSGGNYVGGLIGNLSSGSVTSCYSYANITGTDNVGGIVGRYELADGVSPQIASSGYFGNISARSYVGGILGQIVYTGTGTLKTGDITIPTLWKHKTYTESSENIYEETWTEANNAIVNCAAIGDVIGTSSYVGGILGKGCGGKYYKENIHNFYPTHYDKSHSYNSKLYYYYSTIATSSYYYGYSEGNPGSHAYYTYTLTETSPTLTDNYFSGNLKGTDYVGGVAGYVHGGTVSRNYSYAAITGSNKVGGIVGCMEADLDNITTTISSNVTLNSTVTALADAGKVYGYTTGDYLTIATSGTSINKTLNTTTLTVNSVTQETSNGAQHGTLQTQRQLLQSTAYSGLGWNFDTGAEWTSEESKTYPYHQWQTAPPTIESGAVKGSTTLTGKCTDDGTVYITISGNSTVYQATCSGGNWTLTVPALKSGDLIRAWSKNANKEQSYQTATNVSSIGSGTETDPWLIYDAYDLKGVAKAGYYKMMNDVNLASWISANSSTTGWPGVGSDGTGSIIFDGNNKKVTGLWCNTTTTNNGLFSSLKNVTIKDLTVEVASGKQMKGGNYTAILAGKLSGSTVTNVTVKGTVTGANYTAALIGSSTNNTISGCNVVDGSVNAAGGMYVGGMLAYSNNDNMSNCTVNASVKTTGTTGSDKSYRGGVAAYCYTNTCTITDCSFNGTITTSENYARVGGITGYGAIITKCQANVTITATGADNEVGGLAGRYPLSVSQCFSEGTVVASGANSLVGGLMGRSDSPIENCMSRANVTGTGYLGGIVGYASGSVKKCVATGSLLNSSDDGRAGGIVGFIEGSAAIIQGCGGLNKRIETGSNQWGFRIIGGTGDNITQPAITDNYGWDQMPILRNNAQKTVYDDPYEGTAKTTAELQQQSTYTALGWDFTDIWTISNETHQPMLKWLSTDTTIAGDLNGDGDVNVMDIMEIIDLMVQRAYSAQADLNHDEVVDVMDIMEVIDLMIAQAGTAGARQAQPRPTAMSSDYITASHDGQTLTIGLENAARYSAFQMMVTVPEGVSLSEARLASSRSNGHTVSLQQVGDNQYMVVGFSLSNKAVKGHAGELLSIGCEGAGSGEFVVSDVLFATPDFEGYRLSGAVASGTVTAIGTTLGDGKDEPVYDLQGRRVLTPVKKKGLYISNGKKVVK